MSNDVNEIYYYQKKLLMDEYMQRKMHENWESEIFEKIMSQINVNIETQMVKTLEKALAQFFR